MAKELKSLLSDKMRMGWVGDGEKKTARTGDYFLNAIDFFPPLEHRHPRTCFREAEENVNPFFNSRFFLITAQTQRNQLLVRRKNWFLFNVEEEK